MKDRYWFGVIYAGVLGIFCLFSILEGQPLNYVSLASLAGSSIAFSLFIALPFYVIQSIRRKRLAKTKELT